MSVQGGQLWQDKLTGYVRRVIEGAWAWCETTDEDGTVRTSHHRIVRGQLEQHRPYDEDERARSAA